MAAADTTEAELILEHRLKRLLLIIPDYPSALELALSPVDLHQAEDMVVAGCPPELLVRILL